MGKIPKPRLSDAFSGIRKLDRNDVPFTMSERRDLFNRICVGGQKPRPPAVKTFCLWQGANQKEEHAVKFLCNHLAMKRNE